MNIFISILYAPFVFYAIENFELKTVSLVLGTCSFIWLILAVHQGIKSYIFPLFYLLIALLTYFMQAFVLLKVLPLLISGLISIFILYTYLSKNSFVFLILERMNKQVDYDERNYIQQSTLFWFLIAVINICIHAYILFTENMIHWTLYSSVGWYALFLIAGLAQFFHRKIYFKSRFNV